MNEEYKNLSIIYDLKCACSLLLEKNKTKWKSTFYVRVIERKSQSISLDKCNYYEPSSTTGYYWLRWILTFVQHIRSSENQLLISS